MYNQLKEENLIERMLYIEEIKMSLYEYNLTDEESERVLNNYQFHISRRENNYIELNDFCEFINDQYINLIQKGYAKEKVRNTVINNGKYLIKNSPLKMAILEYLGKEIEEKIYLNRPNLLFLNHNTLYARFAFLSDYNKMAIENGKRTYSIHSCGSNNQLEKIFKKCDADLIEAYPLPELDIFLNNRYSENPKKAQFIKTMLIYKAQRNQKEKEETV
ncbi:MAG: hypothetical protein GX861_03195 [Tenericutes bacterium]|nr:hypothetical protein [Mycoplasmatota bacterium]